MSLFIAVTFIIVGTLVLLSTFDIKVKQLPSSISCIIRSISLVKHISKTNILIIRYVVLLLFIIFIVYSIVVSHLLEGYMDNAIAYSNEVDPSMGQSTPTYQYSTTNMNYLQGVEQNFDNGDYSGSSSPMDGSGSTPNSGPTAGPVSSPNGQIVDQMGVPVNVINGAGMDESAGYGGGDGGASQQNFSVDMNTIDVPPIYYQPGSIMFNGTGPIPSYDDLYVSTLTNMTQVGFIENAPYLSGGFCQTYANDTLGLEQKCNSLSRDICASTDCCVLLGGQKCIAGNSQGPLVQSNFSDFTVKNRDMYFYKGKCYGNCPNNNKDAWM